jgi:hypothetical protein
VFPGSEGKPLASRWDYEQWHRALDAALEDKKATVLSNMLNEEKK